MAKLNVASSIDPDAKIHAQFDDLYRQGQGFDFFGVARFHISAHGRDDAGPKLTIKIDGIERAANDTDERACRELLEQLIKNRGGDLQLEFPKTACEALKEDIDAHAKAKRWSKAAVQQKWHQFFNPNNDTEHAVPGPLGAQEQHLREFAIHIGAIEDSEAKGKDAKVLEFSDKKALEGAEDPEDPEDDSTPGDDD